MRLLAARPSGRLIFPTRTNECKEYHVLIPDSQKQRCSLTATTQSEYHTCGWLCSGLVNQMVQEIADAEVSQKFQDRTLVDDVRASRGGQRAQGDFSAY